MRRNSYDACEIVATINSSRPCERTPTSSSLAIKTKTNNSWSKIQRAHGPSSFLYASRISVGRKTGLRWGLFISAKSGKCRE